MDDNLRKTAEKAVNRIKVDWSEFEEFEKKIEYINKVLQSPALLENEEISSDTHKTRPTHLENVPEPKIPKKKPNVINRREEPTNEKPTMSNLKSPSLSQEAFMRMVEEDAARRAADRAQRKANSDQLRIKGNEAFKEGRLEKALIFYNEAIDATRDSAVLYENRALVNLRLGLFSKACADCDRAVRLKDSIKPRLLKWKALKQMGENEQANTWLQETKAKFENKIQIITGKEKLLVPASEPVRLVLDADGTQVEDGEYFRTLPNNTVLLLLRPGERWHPHGVDVIRAAISAIPKIVCETIHALELHEEVPSWKIMDNKGRVTVVLHWDHPRGVAPPPPAPALSKHPSLASQTSVEKGLPPGTIITASGKKETLINDVYTPPRYTASPQITVINHDDLGQKSGSYHPPHRLQKQGSSIDSTIHIHTPECANHAHNPVRAGSPGPDCDFHCCALHEEGRKIAVHKSVATSPIQDQHGSPQPSSMADGRRTGLPKQHVRFLDIEGGAMMRAAQTDHDSSESENETTVVEEEQVTSEKFLLLIDHLSVEQKRHLTIKDIGVILERLSSKIVDVERLDRESESEDCYNWTIKATIRGDVLRELGVIYNGNYYAISEHPGYREDGEDNHEEAEEEEDEEEDRL